MSRPISLAACTVLGLLAFVPSAHAALLLGTTVNGELSVSGGTNVLTPPSAIVSDPGVEFTFGGQIAVDFTDTDLLITLSNLNPIFGLNPEVYRFTDAAFAGVTVTELNDTFPAGGLTPSLVGTTLTLTFVGTNAALGTSTLTASYLFTPAADTNPVPEPATLGMAAVASLAGLVAYRRRKRTA